MAVLLPSGWLPVLIDMAKDCAIARTLTPPHSMSREDSGVGSLPIHCVGGRIVQRELPLLVDLYRTTPSC